VTFGPTVDPVLLPPDIEELGVEYLSDLLAPTPVATRIPSPEKHADTINGFLRIENGGGFKPNRFQYDAQCLIHGYSPDEIEADRITRQAVALMSAGRGQTVDGWYVVGVMNVVVPHRLSDPDVIGLVRYRAMVTWRVAGRQWNP
jgi:hypothetical protein